MKPRAFHELSAEMRHRLSAIEGVIFDCDGVLTNGEILYDHEGRRSLAFYSRDGLGLALLCRSGVHAGIVSGRPVDIAEARHRELGVETFVGRCRDKGAEVVKICREWNISPEACAFVGDDLVDLPGFGACGLGIAVADATDEVRLAADWITPHAGGRGAVRDVCEAILQAKGLWDEILRRLQTRR